ncbi:MAG: hypothetical protein A2X94_09020 [Bdellovibrionales bacterium GWB1_55_8]|nr:MAG: hypothetical protein A2X94_09020 [Bdellovibrionales bacterium GWB1_55_8]
MHLLRYFALVALISSPMSFTFADEGRDQQNPGPVQGPGQDQNTGEGQHPGNCPGRNCTPPTKSVCFNLVCHYDFQQHIQGEEQQNGSGLKSCKVAARFDKLVTIDGGEVTDDSIHPDNPELEVSCDDKLVYNNSARRFTDLLGTRIQGQMGPHPAITLPRGALHAGSGETSGRHIAPSVLELDTGRGFERARGTCYIWTGAPLL